MKKTIFIILVLVSIAYPKTKFIELYIGSEKFRVEIADTWEKRIRGMMYRQVMADNFGMLLVFDTESPQSIWMKNCLLNMDIIFLDKNKYVVDKYVNVPPCRQQPCDTYVSKKPAMFVLELRGNRSKELKLKIGDHIKFFFSK